MSGSSWRTLAIARHELRLLRSAPVYLVALILMPLLVMAFVKPALGSALVAHGYTGATGAEQAVPGMAVMSSMFLMATIGFSFYQEHGWGTWERLRASHARPMEIMVGKVVVPLLEMIFQLTVLFMAGVLILGLRSEGSLVALAAVGLGLAVYLVSLGLALVALTRTILQLNIVTNLGAVLLAGLGGAITPLETLPGWARALGPATPSYWAMNGFRTVILDGGDLAAVVPSLAALMAFSAGFVLIARARFRFTDTKVHFA